MTRIDPPAFPAPSERHPVRLRDGSAHAGTVFLAAAVRHARMQIGEYTYASAHEPPDDWAARLAPYLYDFSPERLIIGKFCQIADGVTFITASANHRYDGISAFPFAIFGGPVENRPSLPASGADTVIGNDVWIGQGATILPGAVIGDGTIVAARAVVGGEVPPYSVVAGNPAKVKRTRFAPEKVKALQHVAWWHWPIADILASEELISGADVEALLKVAQ